MFFSRLSIGSLIATLIVAIGAMTTPVQAQNGLKSEVRTEQVHATLLAHAPQGVPVGGAPGAAAPVWLGLRITHQPGWHTYWKNSGDSGLPTELQWTLPPGVMAGDVAWPLPRKIPIGDLANYGYEGTVLLPVPLIVTPGYQPPVLAQAMDIRLKATWLVCRQECIPQEGEFALQLPLRSSTALNGAAFDAALASQPAELPGAHQAALRDDGRRLAVRVAGLPASVRGQALELFPETPNILVAAAAPGDAPGPRTWTQRWDGDAWTADLPVSPDRADSPARLPLVLVAGGQGWRADAAVEGDWPAPAPLAGVSPALEAALQANAAAEGAPEATGPAPQAVPAGTFALALLGALVGGLVLNLMPCVFPVLAIKVLGFARHGGDRRAQRLGGLAYGAGVVLSFVLLGALMLALRAAGQQLGWGFQLQSPAVVAALAALFTVIGLNLAGVFEFGHFLPSGVATLQARHPVADAGLSGVLAVAVASPCTAPFMGASLGLAVGLPVAQALAIFAAIGLGMALPYLAATWVPAVAGWLPRPGAWMDVFRKFMAFPMFGTAVWLLWVLGQQSGIDGAAALLALLVALAFVLWTLGLAGRTRWVVGALAVALGAFLLPGLGPLVVAPAPAPATAAAGERWQPWSPGRAQAVLAGGQPVFVDFTAAWCVTCQYNKKTTLASAEVLDALDAARVQTLRADWTRRDAAITAELQKLGRSGVPVYLLQAPGQPPVVLSEILSVGDVKGALARLKL
jgi:thiol:disulfide interchange protein/DsbC/DsbD-like thiol-disulfide interchange protein